MADMSIAQRHRARIQHISPCARKGLRNIENALKDRRQAQKMEKRVDFTDVKLLVAGKKAWKNSLSTKA